jgi:hypothetical protein
MEGKFFVIIRMQGSSTIASAKLGCHALAGARNNMVLCSYMMFVPCGGILPYFTIASDPFS